MEKQGNKNVIVTGVDDKRQITQQLLHLNLVVHMIGHNMNLRIYISGR